MYELYDMYMLVFELMFYITTCYKLFYFIIWVWRDIYGKKKMQGKISLIILLCINLFLNCLIAKRLWHFINKPFVT
jgi:hypothetical protein